MLSRIFPAYTESSLFVMTLSLFAVIFLDNSLNSVIHSALYDYFDSVGLALEFNNNFIGNTYDLFILLLFGPSFLIAVIFASLYLPFTKKDLRKACILIVLAHSVVLIFANLTYVYDNINYLNSFFFLYSLTLFPIIFIRMKNDEIDDIISPKKDKAIHAILLGIASLLIVYIMIMQLKTNWALAYSAGFFNSIFAGQFLQSITTGRLRN